MPKGGDCWHEHIPDRDMAAAARMWREGDGARKIARMLRERGHDVSEGQASNCFGRSNHFGERPDPTTQAELREQRLGKISDLLQRSGIDPSDIGKVQSVRLSEWQGLTKDSDGEAELHDLTGSSVVLTPTWDEGPKWPVVQPAAPVNIHPATPTKRKRRRWKTAVILPDPQIGFRRDIDTGELDPFHDEKAIDAALRVVAAVEPDEIVWLGDYLDLAMFGKFAQEASFANTVQATIDAGHRIMAKCRATAPKARIRVLEGNHDCLDETTRALTPDGFRTFKELAVGDRVLSVDSDGRRVWEPIQAVHVYDHDGPVVRLTHSKVRALVTDNHRIVGRGSTGKWTEKPAGDVADDPTTTMRLVVAARNARDDHPVSDDMLRLLAWCLTDSWVTPDHGYWRFTQRASQVERITSLLDRLEYNYSTSVRHRDITEIAGKPVRSHEPEAVVRVSAADSRRIPFDHHRLPPWVDQLSERQVGVFLDELVFCDGTIPHASEHARVLYVSRPELREQIQALLVTNGYSATATEYRPGHWRLNITDRPTTRLEEGERTRHTERVDYSGKVWCLTVPSGRFFVEHDGTVCLTGNSRLQKFIQKNALAAFGLRRAELPDEWPVLSVPNLLRFDDLDVEYLAGYPANELWLNQNLRCIHGIKVRSASSTAAAVVDDERVSTLFGHVHRVEMMQRTRHTHAGPKVSVAATPGCLCRIDGSVPSTKSGVDLLGRPLTSWENWNQGLAVVSFEPGEGRFAVDLVAVHPTSDGNGRWAMYGGDLFEVRGG